MRLLYLCCGLILATALRAQPTPCPDPPTMTTLCADACIICDIDGFTGRHESTVVGSLPADFCTFQVHNSQWIAFIAGSVDLAVQMSVSNCESGLGLEFALYKSLDCNTFELISNCFGGVTGTVAPGQSKVIENTEPLVIGQYYYLVMDGALGDNCDWTFSVLEGSTAVSPLTATPPLQGPRSTCPEVPATYYTTTQTGATFYRWTLDGNTLSGQADSLVVDWPGPGTYTLCAQAANACDEAPPTCIEVQVAPLPPTLLDPVICAADTYVLPDGTETTASGSYTTNLVSTAGCDSLVEVVLTVLPAAFTPLDLRICEDDTLFLGDTPYFATGQYTQVFTTAEACDSTVTLDLQVIVCDIRATAAATEVSCAGATDGALQFTITDGTPPFFYTYQNLDGSLTGSGNAGLTDPVVLPDLPAATYLVTIQDDFGNERILIRPVGSPEVLTGDLSISQYGAFNVSCHGVADGSITTAITGGTPPYSFAWNTGATETTLTELEADTYILTVTDVRGCTTVESVELTAPAPLTLIAAGTDPDCTGPQTGGLAVLATGGSAPYQFDLGSGTFGDATDRTALEEGTYPLRVRDANGCSTDTSLVLTAPVYPVLDHVPLIELALGDSVLLSPVGNLDPQQLRWRGTEYLSCTACPRPVVRPFRDTEYILYGTSADGCTDSLTVRVRVRAGRNLFAPSAFSPNADGLNDRFRLFPDAGAARMLRLQVFDRWGGAVYRAVDYAPTDQFVGWDGTNRGQAAPQGVYAWSAEVQYLDGVTERYGGSLLLLR